MNHTWFKLRRLLILLPFLIWPTTFVAAESPRTMALVDFAVNAPAEKAAESAWLGPAVAELLQAKMQLFSGARTVERMRLASLIEAAGKRASPAEDALPEYLAIIPADILIAGSVSIPPGPVPKIKIRARAIETKTSKIVSEAVFDGAAELSALLKITEELAKTLANGLKLAYTPEQLAYAEPANIDTFKLFLAGNDALLAGRWREAIEAYQKALDGNAGRYYAAAHRLQGEAYQTLAKAAEGPESQKVKDEYLKKFREDALTASGALFDLGLAYKANSLWKEAADVFSDYLTFSGKEGESIRWRYPRQAPHIFKNSYSALHQDGDHRIHFLQNKNGQVTWHVLDADTGDDHFTPLSGPLSVVWGEMVYALCFENDKAFVYCVRGEPDKRSAVVALDAAGKVMWSRNVGETLRIPPFECECSGGRIFLVGYPSDSSKRVDLLTLDAGTGEVLSRVPLPIPYRGSFKKGRSFLRGMDMVRARLTSPEGTWDLSTGRLDDRSGKGKHVRWPTNLPGVTYTLEPDRVRVFDGDAEVVSLEGKGGRFVEAPTREHGGPLVFALDAGWYLIHPDGWNVVKLCEADNDKAPRRLASRNSRFLATITSFRYDYDTPPTELERMAFGRAERLDIYDLTTGGLVSTTLLKDSLEDADAILLGDDIVVGQRSEIRRSRLHPQQGLQVVTAAEARYHLADSLLEVNELDAAGKEMDLFAKDAPEDPRGHLLAMKWADRGFRTEEAAHQALLSLGKGAVDKGTLPYCLKVAGLVYPDIREVRLIPYKGDLGLRGLEKPGVLVGTPLLWEERQHFLIDTRDGKILLRDTKEFTHARHGGPPGTVSSGSLLYGIKRDLADGDSIVRVDLRTGERLSSLPTGLRLHRFAGGLPFSVAGSVRKGEDERILMLKRGPDPADRLLTFDPDTLSITSNMPLDGMPGDPVFTGEGLAVFAGTGVYTPSGVARILVLDTASSGILGRLDLPLKNEMLVGLAADRTTVYASVAGGEREWEGVPGVGHVKGWNTRLRVVAVPFAAAGSSWSFQMDGFAAGRPILERGEAVLPAYEGRLPLSFEKDTRGNVHTCFTIGSLNLKRIRLNLRNGSRLPDNLTPLIDKDPDPSRFASLFQNPPVLIEITPTLLNGRSNKSCLKDAEDLCGDPDDNTSNIGRMFVPPAPVRLVPGGSEAFWERPWENRQFVTRPPGEAFLEVRPPATKQDYDIVVSRENMILSGDTLYEYIGGGVILLRDATRMKKDTPLSYAMLIQHLSGRR